MQIIPLADGSHALVCDCDVPTFTAVVLDIQLILKCSVCRAPVTISQSFDPDDFAEHLRGQQVRFKVNRVRHTDDWD